MSNLKKEWELLHKRGLSSWVELVDGQYLLTSTDPKEKSLKLDFNSDFKKHLEFFKTHSVKKELLAKAVGLKKQSEKFHVLDLTCGLGSDSLLFLSMGMEVTSLERHPLPRILVQSAYDIFQFSQKNAWHLFPESVNFSDFNALYFDPMYGEDESDKKPKKKMRIFREVLGMDTDAEDVAKELKKNGKRLVVKRPKTAEPLAGKPTVSFKGKSTRYDVYL